MRGVLACLVVVSACGYPKLPQLGDDTGDKDAANDSSGDAPAGFAPIHVDPTMLLHGAPDLVVTNPVGIANINTTTLTINNANNAFFVKQGPYAVLYANAFSIQGATTITGSSPLIVVATDRITITQSVSVAGTGTTLGAGAISTGAGVGSPGQTFVATERESSGGGGGSYGSLGGPGGTSDPGHIAAGASGVRYGMNPTDPLVGGSSGGAGGFTGVAGGGGGGAVQLSSAMGIDISATINAGGGGGGTGGTGLAGGGGGGSGGEIFLEAPMITISGTVVANGGGGGGGGANGSTSGTVGSDGAPGPGVAAGGAGGIPQGSPGGAGAAGLTGAFIEAKAGDGSNSKGGGGGGGAGRIWLRFHASTPPDLTNGRISPPATNDTTLP